MVFASQLTEKTNKNMVLPFFKEINIYKWQIWGISNRCGWTKRHKKNLASPQYKPEAEKYQGLWNNVGKNSHEGLVLFQILLKTKR